MLWKLVTCDDSVLIDEQLFSLEINSRKLVNCGDGSMLADKASSSNIQC
jgi:hypothetical protein